MKSLLDTYKRNMGKPLFTVILDIDYYDGPTEAICKLVTTDRFFLCSLIFFDTVNDQRIFTVLDIADEWISKNRPILDKFKKEGNEYYEQTKKIIESFYRDYSGDVFLFKGSWLLGVDYKIVQVPLNRLKYFKDIEDVLEQSEESKLQWLNFFQD